MGMPRASRTSAEPHLLVTARLPCLATLTPAAAATRAAAVEMLKVFAPSPPVPQVSTSSSRSGGGQGKGDGGFAHGEGEAGDFLGGFAAGGHRGEEGGELDVGGFAPEEAMHEVCSSFEGEGLAALGEEL